LFLQRQIAVPNPPSSDPGGGDRDPFADNRLFNQNALKNRTELEPIDNLSRSTTGSERTLVIALAALAAAALVCLALFAGDIWLGPRHHW